MVMKAQKGSLGSDPNVPRTWLFAPHEQANTPEGSWRGARKGQCREGE